MTGPAFLLIERAGVRVCVSGSLALLEQVTAHAKPFYEVSPVRAAPDGVWIVSCLNPGDERPNTVPFEGSARSEPRRLVFHDLRRRSIVVTTGNAKWLPVFCCRLIRDLLRWQLLERRSLFFQAGLVKIGDNGIAFVGPPRSGKTTTAIALAGHHSGTFVADNDLCIRGNAKGNVDGLGWPRSICIRTNTLSALSEVWPGCGSYSEQFVHLHNYNLTSDCP